ncbi:MAG: deoxyUTP pyrophosphatase [Firmicutes bacterium]|nr:deoxyUTP pyrophosphatase [Bacillota bacterium]
MKNRGFEKISAYRNVDLLMPQRKTVHSAGYDIVAAEDIDLFPGQVTLVPTGLKAYMNNDEYLGIHIRSGLAIKYCLSLINSQGIIDADYYDNPDNEGHIMIAVYNHGTVKLSVTRNCRIAQGIFYKFLCVDNDISAETTKRQGGMGSTGEYK